MKCGNTVCFNRGADNECLWSYSSCSSFTPYKIPIMRIKCGQKAYYYGEGWCSAVDPNTHECKNNGIMDGKKCPYHIPYTESLHNMPEEITNSPFKNAIEGLDV